MFSLRVYRKKKAHGNCMMGKPSQWFKKNVLSFFYDGKGYFPWILIKHFNYDEIAQQGQSKILFNAVFGYLIK